MAFKFASEAERLAVVAQHAELCRRMLNNEIDADLGLRLSKEMLKPYKTRTGKAKKVPIYAPDEEE